MQRISDFAFCISEVLGLHSEAITARTDSTEMMGNAFRPATRSEAKPLIGLYAESGCGQTWSALLLARGFVGPSGKIGMIETEGGRGEANVGREPVGQYLVRPIRGSFSPQEYGEAITDAENEKLDALIIDSASHEWEGAGG